MILWKLFLGFLRVGCFAFGGAYGAIPLIRDVVLSNGWMDDEMITYMIAVSESTPGPIMVNMATYVGNTQAGLPGAVAATVAVVLPAFVIILLITTLLRHWLRNRCVQAALDGMKPGIVGIVLATGLYLAVSNLGLTSGPVVFDLTALVITAILSAVLILPRIIWKKKLSPILLILFSAVLGVIFY